MRLLLSSLQLLCKSTSVPVPLVFHVMLFMMPFDLISVLSVLISFYSDLLWQEVLLLLFSHLSRKRRTWYCCQPAGWTGDMDTQVCLNKITGEQSDVEVQIYTVGVSTKNLR